jgi:hypothetical protein
VNRAPAEIDDLFRMTLSELHIVTGMTRVGTGGGIAAPEGGGHRRIRNRALVSAVADTLELAVP